jgi:hypothetical protein
MHRKGIFAAVLYLDAKEHQLTEQSRVQVFGEFSLGRPEDAWGLKLTCPYNPVSKQFEVRVDIKLGHKFKFVIDDGKAYLVSPRYVRTQDAAGNLNNVFSFHSRTRAQNEAVIKAYSVTSLRDLRNAHKQDETTGYFTLDKPRQGYRSPARSLDNVGLSGQLRPHTYHRDRKHKSLRES